MPTKRMGEKLLGSEAEKRKRIFDIEDCLAKVYHGAEAVREMEKHRMATPRVRRIIVPALVAHLMDRCGANPSASTKEALARELVEKFPFLKDPNGETGHELWYIRGSKNRPATGYLEARLRYVRSKLNAHASPSEKEKEKPKQNLQSRKDMLENITEEEHQEDIYWMKHNALPENTVAIKMKRTAMLRYEWVRGSTRPDTADILEKYPRLVDAGMIEQDFELTIDAAHDALFAKWPKLSPLILEYADKVHPTYSRDIPLGVGVDQKMTQSELENLAFSVLPVILSGRAQGKRGKCSVSQRLESFIDLKPEGTSMDYLMERGIDGKHQPQPFVVIIGSRTNPLQSFVMMERRAIPFQTLTKAVDYCFKLIYVLDVQYQPNCHAVWEFLQQGVYRISTGSVGASVRELMSFISRKEKEDVASSADE